MVCDVLRISLKIYKIAEFTVGLCVFPGLLTMSLCGSMNKMRVGNSKDTESNLDF